MQIVFTTSGLNFNGHSLKQGSLGGSETALICVARELANLGHDVRVFCECDQPGIYDGVQYQHHQHFQVQNAFNNIDVLVSSRWPAFLSMKVPAGLRVLWCHDVCPDPVAAREWMGPLFQTDMLMCLSDYHIADYVGKVPQLEPHIWKTSNGVDLDLIAENQTPKVPGKLIYTSRPERGLIHLLQKIMPRLAETHPEAKLYHCVYDMSGSMQVPYEMHQLYAECDRLSKALPNVIKMPGQTKASLYKHISSAELLVYPTEFPEISCITAMEAQACGTPMITTDGFALSETLGDNSGCKVLGVPSDGEYLDKFVTAVRAALDDAEFRAKSAEAGKQFIMDRGYTWEAVAKSWEQEFSKRLADRTREKCNGVVTNLIRNNDYWPARQFAKKYACDVDVAEYAPPESTTLPTEDVRTEYRRAIQSRFTHAVELMRLVGHRPKKILEYEAGSISAGLAMSRWVEGSDVTLLTSDAIVRKQLEAHKNVNKYDNVTLVDSVPDEKFDTLIVHERLETVTDPDKMIKTLQKKYLTKNGLCIVITRFGTEHSTMADMLPDRYWNFDIRDLQTMFGEARDFNATMSSSDLAKGVQTNLAGELRGHWVCVFRNDPDSIQRIDLQGKYLRTRPYQSIAVCMIANNEEDWISGAIKSAQPIADKLVVALNDSSDRTRQICEDLGVEVRDCDFDNFSQVRNVSKEDVGTDWILWIDSDERLVNADKLRKYTTGRIYNGYAIRQNHLMLDLPGTCDMPIRLLRNNPKYKFVGYIHEHCEDTTTNPFDDPIAPSLLLPDVDIAHYGYLNERARRYKCSARNLELLIRDVEDNGQSGRVLTWVLVIRDYINMVKWSAEHRQDRNEDGSVPITPGSFEESCLNAAVVTFINHFEGTGHRYEELARPMYEEALSMLGKSYLPFANMPRPPFEVGLALFGAVGGLENKEVGAQSRWFRNGNEYARFFMEQGNGLARRLGVEELLIGADQYTEEYPEPPHSELLSQGLHVIDRGA
jgi:glycosyltransferase involved in cell wall biosynthesis